MKKAYFFLLLIAAISGVVIFFVGNSEVPKNIPVISQNDQPIDQSNIPQEKAGESDLDKNASNFQAPIERTSERVIKKTFGTYIIPQTSPVQPERFQGYHTGTDFEIFPEEADTDVPIYAVCSGKLLVKESVSGYGGIVVESCTAENDPITVVYGHLKLTSVPLKTGDDINIGDKIGILGKANSAETDGERKHLHLSLHKGRTADIRGYVGDRSELSGWLDPCAWVCFN